MRRTYGLITVEDADDGAHITMSWTRGPLPMAWQELPL